MSFDISFPEVSCSLLSFDAIDETGLPQTDLISSVYKHKLWNGEKLGIAELHQPGDTILKESDLKSLIPDEISSLPDIPIDECGNCYGAGVDGQCCNTCADVKAAYERKGWHLQIDSVKQCAKEVLIDNWKDQNTEIGGCQIYGTVTLNRASGHFHIAPHKKLAQLGGGQGSGQGGGIFDFLELISFAFSQFNITHTVNSLRFGDQFPGITSPLDGVHRDLRDTHGMYQYYVKVVPTTYRMLSGKEVSSNQYAVTEHMRHLAPGTHPYPYHIHYILIPYLIHTLPYHIHMYNA